MAITDDLRKTLSDPKPLYFFAGTADLAVQEARKVPAILEQLAAEAPGRIDAVRNADPKAVQEKVTVQAKEAQVTVQTKVNEVLGGFDADFKKLSESAQDLALRSVGLAAEYAVRARETYERVAEHGEQAVRTWRGEAAEEITEIAVAVEPEPAKPQPAKAQPPKPRQARTAQPKTSPAAKAEAKSEPKSEAKTQQPKVAARQSTAASRKTTPARKPAAKKTPPPAE
ncbi:MULTISPECIES: hypothetical protein [unclassified Streptomyces]|uniref:hypothetical protein n=1 Tax=unclassified Streptomyces TaxID=2593676 RepID=UPI002E2C52C5|nr:hypothetical protein [Streptomyces sp. NBC_00690]